MVIQWYTRNYTIPISALDSPVVPSPRRKVLSDLALAHELQLSSQEAEAEANQLSSEHLEDRKPEMGDDGNRRNICLYLNL